MCMKIFSKWHRILREHDMYWSDPAKYLHVYRFSKGNFVAPGQQIRKQIGQYIDEWMKWEMNSFDQNNYLLNQTICLASRLTPMCAFNMDQL